MEVKVYVINQGTESKYYGLKSVDGNMVLLSAPNNWKTRKGAERWAEKHGYTVKRNDEAANESEKFIKMILDDMGKAGKTKDQIACMEIGLRYFSDNYFRNTLNEYVFKKTYRPAVRK